MVIPGLGHLFGDSPAMEDNAGMSNDRPVLRFWGVRGSVPTPGLGTVKVGGNTSCVELQAGGKRVIFDAGTGLRALGASLLGQKTVELTLLLSHYHWDHLLGLPFFAPLFSPNTTLHIYGEAKKGGGPREALKRQFASPHFPVDFAALPSTLNFHSIHDGDAFRTGRVSVKVGRLNHPQDAVGYRVTVDGKTVVYASDHEHDGHGDKALVKFCRNADVLIYDAMFTDESYQGGKKGWGHSTWQEAARVAQAAGVKTLVLFHHDPTHDDRRMLQIERALQKVFKGGLVAREGMQLQL